MKQKRDYKRLLSSRKVNKPNKLINWFFHLWCGSVCRRNNVKHVYECDKEVVKKQQIILLSTHSARNEFFYTIYGCYRNDLHIVCGLQNFLQSRLNYKALNAVGVIPKLLFQPDFNCVHQMLTVIKRGASIALFPEGIQSLSGSAHPINPATTRFIKKAGVAVVLAKTQGAYLTSSRYSRDTKRGKVFVNYSLLLSAEQVKNMTEEQIYEVLVENFRYNDFEANKVNRIKYVGQKTNSDGLDNILYVCPKCLKKHSLAVQGDAIVCKECGFSVTVNEYYDLISTDENLWGGVLENIDSWFKWQRRLMHDQVRKDGYNLTATGKLITLRTDCWKKTPKNQKIVFEGKVKLDANGLLLVNSQGESLLFDLKNLYSLTVVVGKYLEFYYRDDYYILQLDIPTTHLVEWTLASEELHNTIDEKWYSASNDMYGYTPQGE